MANRAPFGLAAAAIFALSACGGGGNSSTSIPMTSAAMPNPNNVNASQTYAYPNTAPAGVRIFVHLPLRNSSALDQLIQAQSTQNSPQYHQFLTPAQFRAQFGPAPSDLQTVASTLQAQGFTTAITSQGVVADAPQSVVQRVFNIQLSSRVSTQSRGTPVTLEVVGGNGRDRVALQVVSLHFGRSSYPVATNPVDVKGRSEGKKNTGRKVIGGAGIGAAVGGLLGGGTGAAVGAATGGTAGAIVANKGRGKGHPWIPAETRLQFQLQAPARVPR